jgi:hypothetical protein
MDLGIIVTAFNNATGPLNEIDSGVKKLGVSSQETANRLKAIQVVIGGILLEKSVELGKAFLEASISIQNLDARMASWTGGAQASGAVLEEFNRKLGASGVGIDKMGDAFIKLRTAGVGVDVAKATIENLVNGIAAVGTGDIAGKLDAASSAFQLFISRGVVGGKELRSIITDTGLTVNELAKAMFGGTDAVAKWNEGLKDKTISATMLIDAFNKAAQEKFGGFVSLLGSTVGGALNRFKSDVTLAFGEFGKDSGANNQLAVIFQNLDTAVVQFIKDIKPDDVKKFVMVVGDIASVAYQAATMLVNVGAVVLGLLDIAARFTNSLPSGMKDGLIAGVFLGPKWGLVVGALEQVNSTIASTILSYDKLMSKVGITQSIRDTHKSAIAGDEKDLASALSNPAGSLAKWDGKDTSSNASGFVAKIIGTKEQIQKVIDDNIKLANERLKVGGITPDDQPKKDVSGKIRDAREAFASTFASVSGRDAELETKTAGDTIATQIQAIKNTTQGWADTLIKAKDALLASKLPHQEIADDIAKIGVLQKQINTDTDKAIAQAIRLNDLKTDQFNTEQASLRLQLTRETEKVDLGNNKSSSPTFNALSSTGGGQLMEQVAQQRQVLTDSIAKYTADISKLTKEAVATPENAGQINQTIAVYQRAIDASQKAVNSLTAESALSTQFWGKLGSTISNDVGGAISGLIQGTMTWHQVGMKLFGDLVNMAVEYIAKLAEMQILQAAMSAGGGAGGAGGGLMSIIGSILPMMGFANGGTFSGHITPFANGGLTNGPTLFGMMGEAGTEAVMPLTRVGGKLGVHASGGQNQSNYHIHVNAIDTQSGLQFIGQHISAIDAGLQQNQSLNRRAGNY